MRTVDDIVVDFSYVISKLLLYRKGRLYVMLLWMPTVSGLADSIL